MIWVSTSDFSPVCANAANHLPAFVQPSARCGLYMFKRLCLNGYLPRVFFQVCPKGFTLSPLWKCFCTLCS